MTGQFKKFMSKCGIWFYKWNKNVGRYETYFTVSNYPGCGTGNFVAKNTAVGYYISGFCETYYLLLAVKTCFEYFYYSAVNTVKSADTASFPVKNIPAPEFPEIFPVVKLIQFRRNKMPENGICFRCTFFTNGKGIFFPFFKKKNLFLNQKYTIFATNIKEKALSPSLAPFCSMMYNYTLS